MTDPQPTHEVSVQDGYARWAKQYDQEENALVIMEERITLPILKTLTFEDILDLGAGTGRYANRFAAQGKRVVALDQSEAMLAIARQAAVGAGLEVQYRPYSLEQDLPFETDRFDLVISALVLCHLENLHHVADEAYRVLRPGGYFLITDFHPAVIAAGWRTQFSSADGLYLLPTAHHSVEDYLSALTDSGFELRTVQDALVREAPAGAFTPDLLLKDGDKPFCLVILAHKPVID